MADIFQYPPEIKVQLSSFFDQTKNYLISINKHNANNGEQLIAIALGDNPDFSKSATTTLLHLAAVQANTPVFVKLAPYLFPHFLKQLTVPNVADSVKNARQAKYEMPFTFVTVHIVPICVGSFARLVDSPEARAAFVKFGVIPKLVRAIEFLPTARKDGFYILNKLMEDAATRPVVISCDVFRISSDIALGGAKALPNSIPSIDATRALSFLAQNLKTVDPKTVETAIPNLLDLATCENTDLVEITLSTIITLTVSPQARAALINNNFAARLSPLLFDNDSVEKTRKVLMIVTNMATEDKAQEQIAKTPNFFNAMGEMFQGTQLNSPIIPQALKMMLNVMRTPEAMIALRDSNSLQHIVRLANDATDESQKMLMAKLISNILSEPDCLDDLYDCGIISYLAKQLNSKQGDFMLEAARGVKNMCIYSDKWRSACLTAGMLTPLTQLLRVPQDAVKSVALGTLKNLAMCVRHAHLFKPILADITKLAMDKNAHPQVRAPSLAIIVNLCRSKRMFDEVSDGIPLGDLIDSLMQEPRDLNVCTEALRIVRNFTFYDRGRKYIAEHPSSLSVLKAMANTSQPAISNEAGFVMMHMLFQYDKDCDRRGNINLIVDAEREKRKKEEQLRERKRALEEARLAAEEHKRELERRHRKEELRRKQMEEERKKREEEEAKRIEAVKREQERKRKEAEEQERKRLEIEAKKNEEETMRRIAEEQRKRKEFEEKRREEERKKREAERKKREEQARLEEEKRQKEIAATKEEERRKKLIAEAEERKRKQEEEEQKRLKEEARLAEEERKKKEAEEKAREQELIIAAKRLEQEKEEMRRAVEAKILAEQQRMMMEERERKKKIEREMKLKEQQKKMEEERKRREEEEEIARVAAELKQQEEEMKRLEAERIAAEKAALEQKKREEAEAKRLEMEQKKREAERKRREEQARLEEEKRQKEIEATKEETRRKQLIAEAEMRRKKREEEDRKAAEAERIENERQRKAKQFIYRTNVVQEILETERNYVENLNYMLHQFYQPLLALCGTRGEIISKAALSRCFTGLENMVSTNTVLCNRIETRLCNWTQDTLFGDIFIDAAPHLKCYVDFVNNYEFAHTTFNKQKNENEKFQSFIKRVNDTNPDFRIHNCLITPIQRVPRYILLLSDLRKSTDADHPDIKNLEKAVNMINDIAVHLNEKKREAENMQKIAEIQSKLVGKKAPLLVCSPPRWFIAEYNCFLHKSKHEEKRNGLVFLFDDIILITKKKFQKYSYKVCLSLQVFSTLTQVGNLENAIAFGVTNAKLNKFHFANGWDPTKQSSEFAITFETDSVKKLAVEEIAKQQKNKK